MPSLGRADSLLEALGVLKLRFNLISVSVPSKLLDLVSESSVS